MTRARAARSVTRARPAVRSVAARPRRADVMLAVDRLEQPDDVTCGPACLAQVYRFYGLDKPLSDVIEETPRQPDGGTLIPYLGARALRDGFGATVYPFALRVFDPTWRALRREALLEKLRARREAVASYKVRESIDAYVEYMELGGRVCFRELNQELLERLLARGTPVLTGLSATYLYRQPREVDNTWDDVRGFPVGHFVVISGYSAKNRRFTVRDPSKDIPFSRTGRYSVPAERLVSAILLGAVTFDAALLVLEKNPRKRRPA